jgi:hypothetical protein
MARFGCRLALDVDGVVANFADAVIRSARKKGIAAPSHWSFAASWKILGSNEEFDRVWNDVWRQDEFWASIQPFQNLIVPSCVSLFVSSRPCPRELTERWLLKNLDLGGGIGVLPAATAEDKLRVLLHAGARSYVEDRVANFAYLREERGPVCWLFDRPWNRFVETPARIYSLADVRLHVSPCPHAPVS